MKLMTSRFWTTFTLGVAVWLLGTANADAQFGFRDEPDEASERHALIELLDMEIEDIDLSIDLSDVQIRQLKLAAKAVVNKAIENREVVMLPRGGIGRETLDLKGYFSDEDEETEGESLDEGDGLVRRVAMPINKSDVLESELWKKAVTSVLNADQKRVRKKQEDEFEKRVRDAAIEYRLMHFAYKLRLAEEQYDKMRAVIDKIQGDDLVKRLKSGNSLEAVFRQRDEIEPITSDDVEEFLSETQLKRFESIEDGRFGGRINVVPRSRKDAQKIGITLKGNDLLEVQAVKEETVAEELGVMVGDVIDRVGDDPIDSRRQLRQAIEKLDKITSITVVRDGETIKLESK